MTILNFLRGNYHSMTSKIDSFCYSSVVNQSGTQYSRGIQLNVSYTFGYGKKVNPDNEINAAAVEEGSIR